MFEKTCRLSYSAYACPLSPYPVTKHQPPIIASSTPDEAASLGPRRTSSRIVPLSLCQTG
jgi:hypothetical protein